MAEPKIEYFECHITIDPVLDPIKIEELRKLVHPLMFEVATLLMVKDEIALSFELSNKDSFMTARHSNFYDLHELMVFCINRLAANGYTIRRTKIEAALIDIRF